MWMFIYIYIYIYINFLQAAVSSAGRASRLLKVAGSNPSSGQGWAACRSVFEWDTDSHIAHQWGPCDELATCPASTLPSPCDNAGTGSSSNNPRPHEKGYAVTDNDMTWHIHFFKRCVVSTAFGWYFPWSWAFWKTSLTPKRRTLCWHQQHIQGQSRHSDQFSNG